MVDLSLVKKVRLLPRASIAITILGAIVTVRATSSMGMLKMSSWSRGKTWLLLSSRIVFTGNRIHV